MSKRSKEKNPKQLKGKEGKSSHGIETPHPPQVIDPSSPPGKGKNEKYKKDVPLESNKDVERNQDSVSQ